jgi:hypothetical protein
MMNGECGLSEFEEAADSLQSICLGLGQAQAEGSLRNPQPIAAM